MQHDFPSDMLARTSYLSLLAALFVFSGCSLLGRDTEVRSVPVQQFELVAQTSRTVQFDITGQWRNTCGEFSHFESSLDGTTYSITMYGQQPDGATCGQAPTPISGKWSTEIPNAGTYAFQFQREDSSPLDTSIVFGDK